MKKTYLFINDTDFTHTQLTGAHKRFIELVTSISKDSYVILISHKIDVLENNDNILFYELDTINTSWLPAHIDGIRKLCKKLKKYKNSIKYDYAISFGPSNTISYKLCGYKRVVSLFREDFIGYQKALGSSKFKLVYSQIQEILAVRASDKIIVQCLNDKENLIKRNRIYCKNVEDKVYIQINNANASWMQTNNIKHIDLKDGKIRILFIGGFSDARKGHGILLPAIARLIDDGFNIELLIAGDGRDLETYKTDYAKYSEIKFLGRVNEMEQYLSVVDFEIVPSLIDSCPNTVLEGLNAGIAVYGANTGGISDLLLNDTYLFEPNANSIYVFLKDILEHRSFIKDSVDQMKMKERLIFNWSRNIVKIIEEEK